jgi:hypothetical protein
MTVDESRRGHTRGHCVRHRRELLADDVPIKLGVREFDLLMVLIAPSRAVISEDDLLARLWPDRVVAEANLKSQIFPGLFGLVAKSLVVAEIDAPVPRYRLLDTTRAYALEKLAESGEREQLARRHAPFYRDLFSRAETELEARPTAEWLGDYRWRIGNLRAALDWAFSPNGDAEIGVALTAAAGPLWMHLWWKPWVGSGGSARVSPTRSR